jgi:rubrerythrin
MASQIISDKSVLEARIRQLLAIDKNAVDIYTELADLFADELIKTTMRKMAGEERGHVKLGQKILSLLGS